MVNGRTRHNVHRRSMFGVGKEQRRRTGVVWTWREREPDSCGVWRSRLMCWWSRARRTAERFVRPGGGLARKGRVLSDHAGMQKRLPALLIPVPSSRRWRRRRRRWRWRLEGIRRQAVVEELAAVWHLKGMRRYSKERHPAMRGERLI